MPEIDDGGSFLISKIESNDARGVTGIIKLPDQNIIKVKSNNCVYYISQHEIIEEFINTFYVGKSILWNKTFRVFRKVDSLNVDIHSNYIGGIRKELSSRRTAEVIMVDISSDINGIEAIIGDANKRKRKYPCGLSFLKDIKDHIPYTNDMIYDKARPREPLDMIGSSMFDIISKENILVHFPYESFDLSTVRLLQEAAEDPNVISIKQTLYRVSKDSPLTKALIDAAKAGKQVVVLLELKAKMDEWNNLLLAEKLKQAGVNIIFGPVEMKIHAKTTLIVRRENDKIVKYANISTGNFNDKTARLYEDISYFVKERSKFRVGDDLSKLFNYLGGYSDLTKIKTIIISPNNFRSTIIEQIDNCIKYNSNNISEPATITMKMNSLTDVEMANKLKEASCAGVKIRLIVRGMCILIPGIEGVTDNIEVISIIGRYLEHSRVYEFNYGVRNIYIGSGDLMTRNLDHRVEVLIPVKPKKCKDHLHEFLEDYFNDNTNKYICKSDGSYDIPTDIISEDSFSVQNEYIQKYKKIEKSIIK
jgi:polyphosphate kinase